MTKVASLLSFEYVASAIRLIETAFKIISLVVLLYFVKLVDEVTNVDLGLLFNTMHTLVYIYPALLIYQQMKQLDKKINPSLKNSYFIKAFWTVVMFSISIVIATLILSPFIVGLGDGSILLKGVV